jgi:hypothetical protein
MTSLNLPDNALGSEGGRHIAARRIEEVRQRQIAYESRQARVKEKQSEDRDRRSSEHKQAA